MEVLNNMTISIINKTRSTLPNVPFAKIKNEAMGSNYNLSLVFIGETRSKKLNFSYRGKNKSTNILSFPLDKKNGEIFITLAVVKRQTKKFRRNLQNLVAFLFIHGLMHLKGHLHGDTMDRAEAQMRRKFSI